MAFDNERVMGTDFNIKKSFYTILKRYISLVMFAVMLGVSNVIFEEDRSVNDTRLKTEVVQAVDDCEDVD